MVKRRDDEDELPPQQLRLHKQKKMKLLEEDNDEKDKKEEESEEEKELEDAKPVGDPIRVSGKGRRRKRHYKFFKFDGNQYALEDPVLLAPEDEQQKPYVAIIKDITQNCSGNIMVTGQWVYRPEEAKKKGGGSWESHDSRELFYSFHRDEVPAESIMHKCVVHFLPLYIQIPRRSQYPGFVVQQVYDTVEKKLRQLTDEKYKDVQQEEIDELVEKTLKRIGDLVEIEPEEDDAADGEDFDVSTFK